MPLIALLLSLLLADAAFAEQPEKLQIIDSSPRQNDSVQPIETPALLKQDETGVFRLPDLLDTPAETTDTTDESFVLVEVLFRGNTVVSTEDLQALVAPHLGKQVTLNQIDFLREQLTRLYIERGYINSGLLLAAESKPQQGTVLFDVIEGKLQEIRIQGTERLQASYIRDRLKGDDSEPFNLESLRERYQLLLNDPLIAKMNARLLPGTTPGQAILDVDITRNRPWQFSVFYDNYRSPAIGSYEQGFNGSVSNLTTLGDLLEASVTQSADESSSIRESLGWKIPLNSWGTDLTLRYEHGESTVTEEPLSVLRIENLYDTEEIGLGQTLYESMQHRLSTGISYSERESETFLLGSPFSFVANESTGKLESSITRFWQEYTWRSSNQALVLRSTFSEAKSNLKDPGPALPTSSKPDKTYNMWSGQLAYLHKVMENGAQVSLKGTFQNNQVDTLPTDDFVLGGVSTIRGYRENQFVFDKGYLFNLEFHYPLPGTWHSNLNLVLRPFIDYGVGFSNTKDEQDTVSSAGIAVDASLYGVNANIAIAKGISHPDYVEQNDDWQDKGVHFKIAYNF